MRKTAVAFGIVSIIALSSCGSKSNEELIVGDWCVNKFNGNTPETVSCMKFKEDGTVRFYYEDDAVTELMDSFGNGEGTYSVEGEKLNVNQNNMNPITYDILKLDEENLHLESHGTFGAVSEYKKE